ncbi:nuclear cap-binding protein subunit 3-like [Plodia interpunctella]|uniref:nuclear cap-binding protein subunit 3-like n=1 Tax=Plodia interpunctella TaxID=58824 RepID=UPI00236881AA|nr:nuclear cap-binding protein subunit 3-like [Plodia interpunctella]
MEREEGEMSDDNEMFVDNVDTQQSEANVDCAVIYKAEKDGLVVQKLEKIDASKIEERAKRFGLNLTGNRVVTQRQIDELYANCGIESGNERHFRFDTLHLSGVNGLSTRDIFEYLEEYKPVSLEKLDESSCNVVCPDHITAALAILVHSREIKNEELKEMLAKKSRHHWREGVPHPKQDLILIRFATNGDKKMPKQKSDITQSDSYYNQSMDSVSKNPWGDLCKSWGVYDHQEVFQRKLPKHDFEDDIEEHIGTVQIKNKKLAMRLGKRTHRVEESESSDSESEWKRKSKTPRMRMHADDEESKIKKKQTAWFSRESSEDKETFAPLSIEVINSHTNYAPRDSTILSKKFRYQMDDKRQSIKESVQSRLGVKIPIENDECSDGSSSESTDHNIMSRVQKVNNNTKSESVWSRLDTKQNNSSSGSDLRQILKSRKQKISNDLRGRLEKSKLSNLRIEIDNTYDS